MSDQPLYTSDHPDWCNPSRCLVAATDIGPTTVEHVGEPVEVKTPLQGRFELERFAEVDVHRPEAELTEFIRFTLWPLGAPTATIILGPLDAEGLAEALRTMADQIGGHR